MTDANRRENQTIASLMGDAGIIVERSDSAEAFMLYAVARQLDRIADVLEELVEDKRSGNGRNK